MTRIVDEVLEGHQPIVRDGSFGPYLDCSCGDYYAGLDDGGLGDEAAHARHLLLMVEEKTRQQSVDLASHHGASDEAIRVLRLEPICRDHSRSIKGLCRCGYVPDGREDWQDHVKTSLLDAGATEEEAGALCPARSKSRPPRTSSRSSTSTSG